ncbi:MAG TPA: hypothetical protein VJO52_02330, partial [Gemmatimonadaceae bacterium]|nr:hypothetical protein [Gemmatimonadaceae bacterium]
QRAAVRRAPVGRPAPPVERRLVWLLVHAPALRETIGEQVGPDDLTHPALGTILAALIAAGPDASATDVAATLPDDAAELFRTLSEVPPGTGFDFPREAEGCIAALRAAPLRRRLRENQRAIDIASDAEKDALIRDKVRLQRELSALGAGRIKSFDSSR